MIGFGFAVQSEINVMQHEHVNETVLLQRIRNRVIDYLDLASDFESQLHYRASVSSISVPTEIICQWRDCVMDSNVDWMREPVFTEAERNAVRQFEVVWGQVCAATLDPMPELLELQSSDQWRMLRDAARRASEVFAERGKLPEDVLAF